jgi:hypothetical protein
MALMADAASEAMLIASETLSANAAVDASTCAHAVSETVSAGKVAANAAYASSRETSGMSGGSGGSGGAAMKSLQSQASLDQGTRLIQKVILTACALLDSIVDEVGIGDNLQLVFGLKVKAVEAIMIAWSCTR